MHADTEDRHIDPRYWLRPNEPVVNAFRAVQGDLTTSTRTIQEGKKEREIIGHAHRESLLEYLTQRGIIDETHVYYGMVFLDLKRYFRRRVDHKANPIYALEFFSSSNTGALETLYLRVVRLLMPKYERGIRFVCDEAATDINKRAAYTARHDCREAFEALVRAVDQARKEMNEKSACAEAPPVAD